MSKMRGGNWELDASMVIYNVIVFHLLFITFFNCMKKKLIGLMFIGRNVRSIWNGQSVQR